MLHGSIIDNKLIMRLLLIFCDFCFPDRFFFVILIVCLLTVVIVFYLSLVGVITFKLAVVKLGILKAECFQNFVYIRAQQYFCCV